MPVEHPLQGIGAVAQQMPAVADLECLGRALPDAVGVGAGPVAGHDLDRGMPLQPGGEGAGLPVGQQIDGAMALEVAEDGPVTLAAAEGEVVNTNHAQCRRHAHRRRPDHPQDGVGADRHRQPGRQARAGLAAEGKAQRLLQLTQAGGTPGLRRRDLGQPLGEDGSRAGIVAAAKASDLQMRTHGAALPGQIGQAPAVAALPPRRRLVAQRAAGRGAGRVGLDDDGVAGREQAVDGHADRQETEHGLGQLGTRVRGGWSPGIWWLRPQPSSVVQRK